MVANERYSISGFPCLYLANSIDGVKAELEITELSHNFFIGDFKVNNSIKYFDLTPTFLKNLNQLSVTKIKVAMLKLLLLMACSIRVNKKKVIIALIMSFLNWLQLLLLVKLNIIIVV